MFRYIPPFGSNKIFVIFLTIIVVLTILATFSNRSKRGFSKSRIALIILIGLLASSGIAYLFAYQFQDGIPPYCSIEMQLEFLSEEYHPLEQYEGEMNRITIDLRENMENIQISFSEMPERIFVDISGRTYGAMEELRFSEIQEVKIGEGSPRRYSKILRNSDDVFLLQRHENQGVITYPEITIEIPRISFERTMGFYLSFSSNLPINEVVVKTTNWVPRYLADGELSGNSVLFKNSDPKWHFVKYVVFQRISIDMNIFLSMFSIIFAFFLALVLSYGISRSSDTEDHVLELQVQFDKYKKDKYKVNLLSLFW